MIESLSNVWDTISQIFRVGRAVPLRIGTRYSVSVEKEKAPVMRFGQDNIMKDSFSTTWLSTEDRANEIELTFFDEANDYASRTIRVSDEAAIAAGATVNSTSATMRGIVTQEHAIREAIYSLNMNKLVQTVTFTAPIEALACTVGDLVTVQHNMMEWGAAGKLAGVEALGGDQYQLKLDQDVQFDDNDWKLILSLSVVNRGQYIIDNVYGSYVTLREFNPDTSERIKRATRDDFDMAVLDTFKSSNGTSGVVLHDATGLMPGQTLTLQDTDVVENIDVTPSRTDIPTDIVTVTMPVGIPETYQGFVIGYQNNLSRPFTIRSIGLTGDSLTRQITCLEYDAQALQDDNMDFTVEDVVVSKPLAAVTDIAISESEQYDTASQKVKVNISWSHDDVRYKHAIVYARVAGEGIKYLGEFVSSATVVGSRNSMIEFIITPISIAGKQGLTSAVQHTPTGANGNPYPVRDVTLEAITGGVKLEWDLVSSTLYATEVYSIPVGTLIDGSPVELENPDLWDGEKIVAYAKKIQTTLTTSYDHITETETAIATSHFYWLRTLDKAGQPSEFVYGGQGTPSTARSFNTVPVYQWSVEAPAKPTGGSYDSPQPDDDKWTLNPVATPTTPGIKLWSSTRTFCNFEAYQDDDWSLPSTLTGDFDVAYTWVAYADDVTGTNFSLARQETSRFIGHAYNQVSPAPSTDYRDYEWQLELIDDGLADVMKPIIDTSVDEAVDGINEDITELETEIDRSKLIAAESGLAAMLDTIFERDVTRETTYGPKGTYAQIEETRQEVETTNETMASINQTLTASLQTLEADLQSQIEVNKTAISTTDSTLAAVEESLRSKIETTESELQAEINTNKSTIADTNSAMSTLEESLRSAIETAENDLQSEININKATIADTNSSMATLEETLRTEISTAESNLQAEINTNKSTIADTNTAMTTLGETLRSEIDSTEGTLQAQVDSNKSSIANTDSAVASLEETLRSEIETAEGLLQAQINTNASSIVSTNSAVTTLEETLRTEFESADSSLQSQISSNASSIASTDAAMSALELSLVSKIEADDNSLQSQINVNKTTISNTNTAMSTLEEDLRAEFESADSSLQSQININKTALVTANESIATLGSTLRSEFAADDATLQSQIDSNASSISNAHSSIASLDTTLTAAYKSADSTLQGQINTNASAIAGNTSSISSMTTKLNASAGSSYAAIQEAMQAAVDVDGKYQAQWEIKTSVNGLQGGVGFYNNGSTTQFLVNADTFAITHKAANGSTNVVKPVFTVTNGQAFMDKAFIKELESVTINSSTLNSPTINAGHINASTLTFVSSSAIPSDIKNSNAISSANSYTNTKSSEAQSNAESFATTKANQAQSNAESFATTKANQAQSNAESYASTKASEAQSNAEDYTESRIYPTQSYLQISGGGYESDNSEGWGILSNGYAAFNGGITVNGGTIEGATLIGSTIYSGTTLYIVDTNNDGNEDFIYYYNYPTIPLAARPSYSSTARDYLYMSGESGFYTSSHNALSAGTRSGPVNSNRFRWGTIGAGSMIWKTPHTNYGFHRTNEYDWVDGQAQIQLIDPYGSVVKGSNVVNFSLGGNLTETFTMTIDSVTFDATFWFHHVQNDDSDDAKYLRGFTIQNRKGRFYSAGSLRLYLKFYDMDGNQGNMEVQTITNVDNNIMQVP
ncbi:phage tail fiber protein [Vibrio maritimus]|uniref:Phage tail fiber protein n=1 Tax=Vibrio maritimus TaxID=990268 RepID=A0A090S817_9VIBR|nr:phage tail fiber protein [Vibrio maritimus]